MHEVSRQYFFKDKLHPKETLSRNQSYPGRSIVIPNKFKKLVNGPGGDRLRHVSTMTGAEVSSIGPDRRLYVRGPTRYTKHAEYLIKSKMAAGRVMANTICVYIDKKNLPEDCEVKLVPVDEKERLILSVGSLPQYRLKPCEEYDMEVQIILSADISEENEADLEETWSIVDSIKKLQATKEKRSEWLVAFKEGVDLADKVVNDAFGEQLVEDFMARYDLTFLSPNSQPMRCKVWVVNKDVGKKLEEIPIPFHDLKNIVEELRFEDEPTRARCRGWLVLQSKKIIQVNIIFPGSDIDCRITLRALTDDLVADSNLVCEKEETRLISKYLSKLTFTDADGLRLPADEKLPQAFNHTHWRCSRRTLLTPRPGFSMIVSNERSWCSDLRDEENRVTTDIHLHCEKWDQLLSEEDWEPEIICAELPEFLRFVRQVQDFISCNCTKTADQE
ncbi:hypothetical protein AWC38_SpisGene21145 [Stylophora pistillata]|uniref:K Homology domain-containing protein n=1 Tax=Stylophora pistillata TaxID=50429 RepID=A0A2B4REK8_STYPI|nr:hypothetical protein AWC38_SpisGene21145 [Stylophora pistillata]